jgi:two-component system NarL family sensor kinase
MSEGVIAGTIVILLLILFLILFLSEYEKQRKQHIEERIFFQQELLRSQLEIQEQTFKNISLEIHDNINQTLGLAKLYLATVSTEQTTENYSKVRSSKDLVSKAIGDLRGLSKSLNAESILSDGLVTAVETEINIVRNTGNVQIEFTVSGVPVLLDPKKELIIFRVIQEAINNVLKHAQARLLQITLRFETELTVQIKDNGVGFQEQSSAVKDFKGSGILNMKNRCRLIGGLFHLETGHEGTLITLTFPGIYV